jgi:hypothetical protein
MTRERQHLSLRGGSGSITEDQWIATLARGLAMTRVVFYHEKSEVNGAFTFVIARRERSGRRGNPSCLGRTRAGMRFAYCVTVNRHGLSTLAMTRVVFSP